MSDPYARFKVVDEDCPDCGEPMRLTEEDIEQRVTCPECGAISRVGYDDATDAKRHWWLTVVDRPCSHPPAMWESCSHCRDAQAGI